MYETYFARMRAAGRIALISTVASMLATASWTLGASSASAEDTLDTLQFASPSVVRKISDLNDKLEITTNSSRILTLDKNIPRVQVNNPELLAVTPLSANQVQISAKKAGVTQVNLWDEDGNIHTVDVLIYGDAKELEVALQTQFPHSSIKVYRYSESLVLKGFVDRPDHVSQMVALAEDYAPKVINNISVGGVQQVLLKVRVMEVSRTKLRKLGVDWAYIGGSGDFAVNSVSGLITAFGSSSITHQGDTFAFGIVDGSSNFYGFLEALQDNKIAKILAEPNLVAVSGRPAQFNVGGEFPIVVPQSLGTASIEFKKYGTQIDFLPIVLGNGNIRLEVRPRISERDFANSVTLPDSTIEVPSLTVREVDTAVEMKAGQTFALAGLVQERTESVNSGLPYLSDLPVIGVPFRRTENTVNEIELLIMVTPEFVDPIDQSEVPCGGPGYATTAPTNCDLYCAGHVEVPTYYNPILGMTACGECGGPCGVPSCNGYPTCNGCQTCNGGTMTEEIVLPGGVGYDEVSSGSQPTVQPVRNMVLQADELGHPKEPAQDVIEPSFQNPIQLQPQGMSMPTSASPSADSGASRTTGARRGSRLQESSPTTVTRTYSPPREPTFVRNTSSPDNRYGEQEEETAPLDIATGLIGPVGYDP